MCAAPLGKRAGCPKKASSTDSLATISSVLLGTFIVCGVYFGRELVVPMALGWVLTRQAVDLANQLPNYKDNIRTKLRAMQVPQEGPFSKFFRTMKELKKDLLGRDSAVTIEAAPGHGGTRCHGFHVPWPGIGQVPLVAFNIRSGVRRNGKI